MNSTHSATELPYVLRQQTNSVVTLTLNRASKFNPLSEEMMTAMQTEVNLSLIHLLPCRRIAKL